MLAIGLDALAGAEPMCLAMALVVVCATGVRGSEARVSDSGKAGFPVRLGRFLVIRPRANRLAAPGLPDAEHCTLEKTFSAIVRTPLELNLINLGVTLRP